MGISRQAAIFKSARWATIWFNRLESFSGLHAALAWASHLYLFTINSYDLHSHWPTSRAHLTLTLSDDVPLATHELLGIFSIMAIHKLLEMPPIDLLTFGNQRHCQDTNRAVVIMSALGTTDWYQKY